MGRVNEHRLIGYDDSAPVMTTVRAILYDAGHTLLRPRPQAADIWAFLSHQLGIELATTRELPNAGHFYYARIGTYDSDERARSFWAEYYAHALEGAGVDLPHEELLSAGNAVYDWYQDPAQWEPFPETLAALTGAHELGYIQGVVSDWGTDLVPILHAHEVTRHLDFVVASATMRVAKPHPDLFRYALERAGLKASEVIYVGDSYVSDVLGARAVGIRAVLIDREGKAPKLDCPVVSSLLDLFELVEA
jgi:putative hydrolase of the HAD superfamily